MKLSNDYQDSYDYYNSPKRQASQTLSMKVIIVACAGLCVTLALGRVLYVIFQYLTH